MTHWLQPDSDALTYAAALAALVAYTLEYQMTHTPTYGQVSLAMNGATELWHHLNLASQNPEGEASREEHIRKARVEVERIAKRLGMEVREREIA